MADTLSLSHHYVVERFARCFKKNFPIFVSEGPLNRVLIYLNYLLRVSECAVVMICTLKFLADLLLCCHMLVKNAAGKLQMQG